MRAITSAMLCALLLVSAVATSAQSGRWRYVARQGYARLYYRPDTLRRNGVTITVQLKSIYSSRGRSAGWFVSLEEFDCAAVSETPPRLWHRSVWTEGYATGDRKPTRIDWRGKSLPMVHPTPDRLGTAIFKVLCKDK